MPGDQKEIEGWAETKEAKIQDTIPVAFIIFLGRFRKGLLAGTTISGAQSSKPSQDPRGKAFLIAEHVKEQRKSAQ